MKSRDHESEIRNERTARMSQLLKSAMPPMPAEPEATRDLWPAMLRRLDEQASRGASGVPWFDWALGGALLAIAAMAPRTIPVILYYL